MDRRKFLALLTLASAATSSAAFAEQVRLAAATGDLARISGDELMMAVYKASLSPEGAAVIVSALVQLGTNKEEAGQIAETARSIASKSGSYENFRAVLQGKTPNQVKLSAKETSLLRSVVAQGGGTTPQRRMWEGSSGRTWEGRA